MIAIAPRPIKTKPKQPLIKLITSGHQKTTAATPRTRRIIPIINLTVFLAAGEIFFWQLSLVILSASAIIIIF